jgi:hypothetical protein
MPAQHAQVRGLPAEQDALLQKVRVHPVHDDLLHRVNQSALARGLEVTHMRNKHGDLGAPARPEVERLLVAEVSLRVPNDVDSVFFRRGVHLVDERGDVFGGQPDVVECPVREVGVAPVVPAQSSSVSRFTVKRR